MTNRMICCLALSLLLGILFGKEQNLLFAAGFLAFAAALGLAAGRDRKKAWERSRLFAENTGCYGEAGCRGLKDTDCRKEAAGYQDSLSAVSRKWSIRAAILFRSLCCLLAFCAGSFQFQTQQQVRNRLETVLEEGAQITLWGEVKKREEKEEQCIYYLTDTRVLAGESIYPSCGILVYSSNLHIRPGNILRVTGSYAPFQISRNEGNFDEKQYYQSKKIEFRLYAEEETLISAREIGRASCRERV